MSEYRLNVPLTDEDIKRLRIGHMVYFSGEAWEFRVPACKKPFSMKAGNCHF